MPDRSEKKRMDELSDIVAAMLPAIQKRLNFVPSTFKLWFDDLRLRELTEDRAVFTTSTDLRCKILGGKYRDIIRDCLTEVIGFEVDISFESLEHHEAPSAVREEPQENSPEEEERKRKLVEGIINGDPSPQSRHSVMDEYTFDNFIEGDSNKFARAACYAVAREPTTYNPLFIYGQSGLGKTHLLCAVVNYIRKNHPHLKIVYKTCESFVNELVRAISDGSTAAFKDRYRSCDVLLIDDIQSIAGKTSCQEEFFNTFNTLYDADKQIILTSDRPPMEIKPLADRLRSRFEGGLLADVQPPSFELRTAIIRKKADAMGLAISDDTVNYMAERLHNNIRQIEGALKKLYAIVSLTGAEVTRERIDQVIAVIDPGNVPDSVMVDRVLEAVSRTYGISVDDLKSKKRNAPVANARHIAVYIIRKVTDLPLKRIGAIFSRDHTTGMASISKTEIDLKTVNGLQEQVDRIIREVKAGN